MRALLEIALLTTVSALLLGTAQAADKKGRDKANVPEMPWLDDKDGTRIDIVEGLIERRMPGQALAIITDLRNDGVTKPVLDLYQGQALLQQGVASEAERLLVSARKKMPGDSRPSAHLCILYADTELFEQALTSCRRATSMDKKDASAWNNYGFLLLFTADQPEEALEALERAVTLDSSQERYRNNLGHAQVANGDDKNALRTFMSTASRADAAYNVAVAHERFGQNEDAILYYEQAIQSEADHTLAHDALARLSKSSEDE